MSRVEIASMPWGVLQDRHGESQNGLTATLKNLNGTNATTWSAVTGGSSSTASLTSDANGNLPRFVEGGQYTLDVAALGVTDRRVEAVSGAVENVVVYPDATDASIRAAITTVAAKGGGTVRLPEGRSSGAWDTITLTSPLPPTPGVRLVGVPPIKTQQNTTVPGYTFDGDWDFIGGTVFEGNGTFALFEANVTDDPSPPASNAGTTQIANGALIGIGGQNFTYGLRVGAKNVMGLVDFDLHDLHFKDCTQWGVYLANFGHLHVGRIHTCLCPNGQWWGSDCDITLTVPGNSSFRELFHMVPHTGLTAAARRAQRGIVLECKDSGGLNELSCDRMQVNRFFNSTQLSVTATLTNASSTVAVPDGTEFTVGMMVRFLTTVGGFTANRMYWVKTVAGNNLTLSNSKTSAALVASAGGTPTMETRGCPNVEVQGDGSATGKPINGFIRDLDSEGDTSAALYTDLISGWSFDMPDKAQTAMAHIVGRGVTNTKFYGSSLILDIDDTTGTVCAYDGTIASILNRTLNGVHYDDVQAAYGVAVSRGSTHGLIHDLQWSGGGFIYPNAGVGEHIFSSNTVPQTLAESRCGICIFAGSAGTWTLPLIKFAASPASAKNIGVWFDIINVGAAALTVATQSSQLINLVAAKTSQVVAAGTAVRFMAGRDSAGTLFWIARPAETLA